MPCYRPLTGHKNALGQVIPQMEWQPYMGEPITVPCSKCVGCLMDRSKQWAIRCVHEARMHGDGLNASFLTLTYDEDHVPMHGSLVPEHHQKFIRSLRDHLRADKIPIRYFMCGEYGADDILVIDGLKKYRLGPGRPHYHYLIFGYSFPDKKPWTTHNGHQYFRSEELEKFWTKGQSLVGHLTKETAAYTARYVLKKVNGDDAEDHYKRYNWETGQLDPIEPEFQRMSLKPGIGSDWFKRYGQQDVYDSGDFIVIDGTKYKAPRYYDKLLQRLDIAKLMSVKAARREQANIRALDNTPERLAVKEEVQQRRLGKLHRGYEVRNEEIRT